MLESNPSADSGAKTETGSFLDPVPSLFNLRFGTRALNSGVWGPAPRKQIPLQTRIPPYPRREFALPMTLLPLTNNCNYCLQLRLLFKPNFACRTSSIEPLRQFQ